MDNKNSSKSYTQEQFCLLGKSLSKKVYYYGLLKKRNYLNPDGNEYDSKDWKLWYVELVGQNLIFYKPYDLDDVDESQTNLNQLSTYTNFKDLTKEQFSLIKEVNNKNASTINISNCFVTKDMKYFENCFLLNNHNSNLIYFKAMNSVISSNWVKYIQFSLYEYIVLQTYFTKLAYAHNLSMKNNIFNKSFGMFEDYVDVRMNGLKDSIKCYMQVSNNKSDKRIVFMSHKNAKSTMFFMQNLRFIYLIYPDTLELIDKSKNVRIIGDITCSQKLITTNDHVEPYYINIELLTQGDAFKLVSCLCYIFNLGKNKNIVLECDNYKYLNTIDSTDIAHLKELKPDATICENLKILSNNFCQDIVDNSSKSTAITRDNVSISSSCSTTSSISNNNIDNIIKVKDINITKVDTKRNKNLNSKKNASVLPLDSSEDSSSGEEQEVQIKNNINFNHTKHSSNSSGSNRSSQSSNLKNNKLYYDNQNNNNRTFMAHNQQTYLPQQTLTPPAFEHDNNYYQNTNQNPHFMVPSVSYINNRPNIINTGNNGSMIYQQGMANMQRPYYPQHQMQYTNNYNRGPLIDLPNKKTEPTGGLVGAISAIQQNRLLNKKMNQQSANERQYFAQNQYHHNDDQYSILQNNNNNIIFPNQNMFPMYPHQNNNNNFNNQLPMNNNFNRPINLNNEDIIKPKRINKVRRNRANMSNSENDFNSENINSFTNNEDNNEEDDEDDDIESEADVTEDILNLFSIFLDEYLEMKPYSYVATKKVYVLFVKLCNSNINKQSKSNLSIDKEDIPDRYSFDKLMQENGCVKKVINNTECWHNISIVDEK